MSLLSVRDLRVTFRRHGKDYRAVEGAFFDVDEGEIFCLVGESGCGKTVTALSLTRLIPEDHGRIESGEVLFKGRDILNLDLEELRKVRGGRISYVFQEPSTSLNPVLTVGDQIVEALTLHKGLDRRRAEEAAAQFLQDVGIPDPAQRLKAYPHELSGGMKQRAMIAMAIASGPELLVADEPTTALDVTIQEGILGLLKNLQATRKLSILFITHDFSIVSRIATHVGVMYLGRLVEVGSLEEVLRNPCHPYTIGLLSCIPGGTKPKEPLASVPGRVPDCSEKIQGCRFNPRCRWASWECVEDEPPMVDVGPGHAARCCRIPAVLKDIGRER